MSVDRRPDKETYSKSLDIVIPAYNEEESIRTCLEKTARLAARYFNQFRILVVDDGSSDSTQAIARQFAQEARSVEILAKENGGVGSAIRYGLNHCSADYAIYIHADLQFDFDEIPLLIEALESENCEMVVGL